MKGLTLIEILVATALVSFVSAMALTLVAGMNGSSIRIREVGEAQSSARLALDGLAQDIRAAGGGANTGQIGVAPGGSSPRRIPVIWSGGNTTVTEPGGQTMVSNSIFIITADPTSIGTYADGTGMHGVVVAASAGTPLTIDCANAAGSIVDCGGGLLSTLVPLIVGDFRDSVYLSPTTLGGLSGSPATQSLDYLEKNSGYSPNPRAPFGFTPGAVIARARVVHWYVWQASPTDAPQLRRSFPTLSTNPLANACSTTDLPFLDETNSSGASVATGVNMGAGSIESLQLRFTVDPGATDDPTQFSMVNSISICDNTVPSTLREVRLEVVSRTADVDLNQQLAKRTGYATPQFEGVSPSATTTDSYPRRAFTIGVVPRDLQGIRL